MIFILQTLRRPSLQVPFKNFVVYFGTAPVIIEAQYFQPSFLVQADFMLPAEINR
jgi:hypothetical protein